MAVIVESRGSCWPGIRSWRDRPLRPLLWRFAARVSFLPVRPIALTTSDQRGPPGMSRRSARRRSRPSNGGRRRAPALATACPGRVAASAPRRPRFSRWRVARSQHDFERSPIVISRGQAGQRPQRRLHHSMRARRSQIATPCWSARATIASLQASACCGPGPRSPGCFLDGRPRPTARSSTRPATNSDTGGREPMRSSYLQIADAVDTRRGRSASPDRTPRPRPRGGPPRTAAQKQERKGQVSLNEAPGAERTELLGDHGLGHEVQPPPAPQRLQLPRHRRAFSRPTKPRSAAAGPHIQPRPSRRPNRRTPSRTYPLQHPRQEPCSPEPNRPLTTAPHRPAPINWKTCTAPLQPGGEPPAFEQRNRNKHPERVSHTGERLRNRRTKVIKVGQKSASRPPARARSRAATGRPKPRRPPATRASTARSRARKSGPATRRRSEPRKKAGLQISHSAR